MALNKIICEFVSKQCSLQRFSIVFSVLHNETIIKFEAGSRDRDSMIVGFTTICAINAYHH